MTSRTTIVLDSGPLGLLLHKVGVAEADACRVWLERQLRSGSRFVIPEIITYEIRRELLRTGRSRSVADLDRFVTLPGRDMLSLTPTALRLAAELWARVRQHGVPTADRHALDIDVIMAAQVLASGLDLAVTRVATGNVKHIGLFVPVAEWQTI